MSGEQIVNGGTLPTATVPVRNGLLVLPCLESTPSDRSVEKRRLRKHFILNVIREHGPLSRAEMAKKSGLNLPSVSSLVDELISDQLVMEEEARPALRGRRPIPVFLRQDAASILGIDIGKRSTTTLLSNLSGKPLVTIECPTPELSGPAEYAAWSLEVAENILYKSQDFMPPLCGIGVAVPGLVTNAPALANMNGHSAGSAAPGMAVQSIQLALKEAFGVEVLVDNDARIMVPGAKWFRDGRPPFHNFAVLNIGYGLGLGISENGRVLQGATGFAGEIGHIPLGEPGIACYCGGIGCLENRASGAALQGMARDRGLPVDDVEKLAAMAREGNQAAQEIFQVFAEALGRGIATIINLFNPEAIILSGKVSRAADVFMNDMKASAARHALPAAFEKTAILVENPRKNLSSLGAVAVVLNQIYHSSQISYEEVI